MVTFVSVAFIIVTSNIVLCLYMSCGIHVSPFLYSCSNVIQRRQVKSIIHASAYICTRNKKFTDRTQDVLVAMLNCQAVRWGSMVMLEQLLSCRYSSNM
jgi:hypothetical protein